MMTADIGCLKTPTRQVPSSLMPVLPSGAGSPVRLQLNLVPLYLPATISPGPFHAPATDWKKTLSRDAAAASGAIVEDAASAAASPPNREKMRRYMMLSLAGCGSDAGRFLT